MAQIIADRRDIDFVLYEQMNSEYLLSYEKYGNFSRKIFDMIITEAKYLAVKELLPTNVQGDREGVKFEEGKVIVPECYRRAFELLIEGEWTALTESPDMGGQGLPNIIAFASMEYIMGGNWSLFALLFLGTSTGKMIDVFGTEQQKRLFLKNLFSGQWGGTMLLTEPNAGSDVGAITTSARRNPDGTYSISGNKIFSTNGDDDLHENIIHPVLARIEGASNGTQGISLFLVPKIWVNENGTLGDENDIVCTGIEEKLGIHGSPSCSMALGSKGQCRGLLLGNENEGMKIMFHMMNEERLFAGFQAFIYASTAYLYAVNYAKDRLQGKDLASDGDPDAPQVPIIKHPDVRRMLMSMKCYVEGMRSLIYYVADCFERINCTVDPYEKERLKKLAELLTPVVKTYCSEHGFNVCVDAIQVFGGAGYTRDYPMEQLLRDCKITSIYEGTSGIQAMDLLGRKLGMEKGQVFSNFMDEIKKTISMASEIQDVRKLADRVRITSNRLGETAADIAKKSNSPQYEAAFAHAHPFLDAMGDVIMAWMLLWRASIAARKLPKALKNDVSFYEGQIKSAQFFIETVLPVTMGKMDSIMETSGAAVEIPEACFRG